MSEQSTPNTQQPINNWWDHTVAGSERIVDDSAVHDSGVGVRLDLTSADFSSGGDNPFDDFAKETAKKLGRLTPEGSAVVPRYRGNTEITYEDIEKMGQGWKFHLNLDPSKTDHVTKIGNLAKALKDHGLVSAFKFGHGGGKAWDQPGKEATVGVGSMDKAKVIAEILEEQLNGILLEPEGDAISDDIEFTDHIVGRFDIGHGFDDEFVAYGAQGHPIRKEDMPMPHVTKDLTKEQTQARWAEAGQKADQVLRDRYGVFYTGS